MPAGSSVIRFPYKILLREKERVEHGNKICVNENPLFVSGPFSIDSAKWNQMRETHLNPKIKDI
jgi:hypothetical protein